MLHFIIHGLKDKEDRESFLWEFSTRGPLKIISMGVYCSNDPPWDPR